ncbi:DUF2884 family protein [Frateuria aurantia]|uniref:DUF2884 family protein n=1 Tax=Frateuria aurantia (strain ATCC 33424 / DSM 6220 / KCTC 2777 / LMG 1558 / NBRC 3245 / NCIMB 13370) TaxID=767434 RepID=H8L3A1_FRAAD|nr:DUF2884 family protein [Frateuria aurantia]AFC85537.1 Protein of unknown function (DUF2884) [Frateuria aurantia DSM 6220]
MKMSQHWPAWIAVGLLTGISIGLTGCQDQDGKAHRITATYSVNDDDAKPTGDDSLNDGHVHIHGGLSMIHGRVVLKAKGQPDASISRQGEFSIDDRPVSLSPEQQAQFQRYYAQTEAVVHQSIDVAKAGAGAGLGISAGVMHNLLEGKTDDASMQATVHEHLTGLSHSVDAICNLLAAQQTLQDQLATQVAAFRPYASITDAQIQECHHGASEILEKNSGDHDKAAD